MAKWEVEQFGKYNYVYVDENGNQSETFSYAQYYSNGFGLVRLKNGKYAYRDTGGNLSSEFEDAWSYKNGFALVELKNGKYAYRDKNGNLSEEYKTAYSYSNGFGLVRLKNGQYAYRDTKGNLSKEFEDAGLYSYGFGAVQLKNGKYAYRDINGNLSEEFLYAWNYLCGFGVVISKDGTELYRDILGNLNKKQNKIGKEAYGYYIGRIDETELSDDAYADAKFLKMIIERVRLNKAQAIDLAESEEQLKIVKEYYSNLIEYIKTRALEIHENEKAKQEAEKIMKEKGKKQIQNIEHAKEELKNDSELEF